MDRSSLHSIEEKILAEFLHLELDKLDSEWVKQTIGQEFLQCDNLPGDYDEILNNVNVIARFKAAQKHCQLWLESNEKLAEEHRRSSTANEQQPSETSGLQGLAESSAVSAEGGGNSAESNSNGAKFWGYLMQKDNFNIHSLVALVGFLIDKGAECQTSQPDTQEKCFAAADLYLTLVCVPGAMAFKIFHKMLYLKALELVQLFVKVVKSRRKESTSKKGSQQQSQQVFDEEDGDDACHPSSSISEKEAAAIERHICAYLKSVELVSRYLSFKRYPNILKESIETMLPVISLGKGPISLKALEIIQQFCNPLHGDAIQTVHYIFIHLLPYLSLDPEDARNLNDRELLALKEISFNLVRNFAQKFADQIYPLIEGLIQHLCLIVVDRAEYRQRTAQTVCDLLNLVPADNQKGTVVTVIIRNRFILL